VSEDHREMLSSLMIFTLGYRAAASKLGVASCGV
jgi:hypothetical protein